ncbi:MAG: phosphopyruvate hydratase [Candidatus Hydrothermarchaeota archaeon]
MEFIIESIHAREILDSRGNPSIEVDVYTLYGFGRASIPSGASTGTHEALELRDGEKRYHGKGVMKAVNNVNEIIAPEIVGMDVISQREIDEKMIELDGTDNKSKLGANAILGVSIAVAKAAASSLDIPLYRYIGGLNTNVLPVPQLNVINGGEHAGNELDIQEFMIMPVGAPSFREAIRMSSEVYHELGKILVKKYGLTAKNVGDEGGYAPPLKKTHEALDVICEAIEEFYDLEKDFALALDCAASSFFKKGEYIIEDRVLSSGELIDFYRELVGIYPIVSIEDPFQEEGFEDFAELNREIGNKVQIVGDDLYVTNAKRFETGIEKGSTNAILLKVNQIGTLTEALDVANLAYRNNHSVVVSHRSGETEDTFIADLAVGISSGQIKTGAPARSERTAKYNRLLRIEEYNPGAYYPGKDFRKLFRR